MPSELAIVTRKEQNGECTSHSKACICFMFRMGMMYAAGKLAEREVTDLLVGPTL
jgi:adenylyl- and sulfurtransferase ThiI